MNQEIKNKNFIAKSKHKYGDNLFDYLKAVYTNTTTQLKLICKKHNYEFKITPVYHLKNNSGCPLCLKEERQILYINNRVGEKYKTNEGYEVEIIEYFGNTKCTILFTDGTIIKGKNYNDIIRGQIKNPNHILKLGKGYVGVGDYSFSTHLILYTKWYNMLNRCYNDKKYFTSYKDVSVCEEWHNFQVFAKWFEENYNPETMQGWHLDKDILVKGNKIYSPKNCCFIPQEVNMLFVKSNSTRGELPIGVSKNKTKFLAKLRKNGVIVCLGSFNTPEEAFQTYKQAKEGYIKEVADKWKDQIDSRVYQALQEYKVEIDD